MPVLTRSSAPSPIQELRNQPGFIAPVTAGPRTRLANVSVLSGILKNFGAANQARQNQLQRQNNLDRQFIATQRLRAEQAARAKTQDQRASERFKIFKEDTKARRRLASELEKDRGRKITLRKARKTALGHISMMLSDANHVRDEATLADNRTELASLRQGILVQAQEGQLTPAETKFQLSQLENTPLGDKVKRGLEDKAFIQKEFPKIIGEVDNQRTLEAEILNARKQLQQLDVASPAVSGDTLQSSLTVDNVDTTKARAALVSRITGLQKELRKSKFNLATLLADKRLAAAYRGFLRQQRVAEQARQQSQQQFRQTYPYIARPPGQ